MSLTLEEIATLVEGRLIGDGSVEIHGVAAIETAAPGDIAALDVRRLVEVCQESKASAILVSEEFASQVTQPAVEVDKPLLALNRLIEVLGLKNERLPEGIHPTAVINPGAEIGPHCAIGPGVVIGDAAKIGEECQLHAHVVIEGGAELGARSIVQANSVIRSPSRIGEDTVIGSCTVIGGEGFGFEIGPNGPERIHHLGKVVIGNRVELGNGSTVDRAKFGATRIGDDVKIDSQVHIGHNCIVGENSIIAAQTGLAGSTRMGRGCLVGGQVGFAGHLDIADGSTFAAKTGVHGDKAKGTYFGFWGKDQKAGLRELASIGKLPEALKTLKSLKEELRVLREEREGLRERSVSGSK